MAFYVAMAGAAYVIELLFGALHLIPSQRAAHLIPESLSWNYTTWLNLIGLGFSALLLWRFMTTGGPAMLKAMGEPDGHDHACHDTGDQGGHAHHHP